MLGDLRAAVATAGAVLGAEAVSDADPAESTFVPHNFFLRLLSVMIHSTSSNLQLVQGAPCSTTLHLTLRARQHWQAFDALRFTGRKFVPEVFPAAVEDLF